MTDLMDGGQSVAMPTDIPTAETIGGGIYTVRVASCKPVLKEAKDGVEYLTVNIEFRILDADFSNSPVWDTIRLGTENDPLARDPQTWKAPRGGGRSLQRFMAAAGVSNCGNLGGNCAALQERQLLVKVTEREWEGAMFNNVRGYFPLGEKELSRDATPQRSTTPVSASSPLAQTAVPGQPLRSAGSFE
jgi:hypothetical protein